MNKVEKILLKILSGNADNNIDFEDLCLVLKNYNFNERIIRKSSYFFQKWN